MTGLGKDISVLLADVFLETVETDSDNDDDIADGMQD